MNTWTLNTLGYHVTNATLTIPGNASHPVRLITAIAAHKLMEKLATERAQFEFWFGVSFRFGRQSSYTYIGEITGNVVTITRNNYNSAFQTASPTAR